LLPFGSNFFWSLFLLQIVYRKGFTNSVVYSFRKFFLLASTTKNTTPHNTSAAMPSPPPGGGGRWWDGPGPCRERNAGTPAAPPTRPPRRPPVAHSSSPVPEPAARPGFANSPLLQTNRPTNPSGHTRVETEEPPRDNATPVRVSIPYMYRLQPNIPCIYPRTSHRTSHRTALCFLWYVRFVRKRRLLQRAGTESGSPV